MAEKGTETAERRGCPEAFSDAQAVGDELIDSIISENIPTLTEAEKFNEALTSCVARIEAKLTGTSQPSATCSSL